MATARCRNPSNNTQEQSKRYSSKAALFAIQAKALTLDEGIANGSIKLEGKPEVLGEFMGLLDNFPFWFNIVTPRT